ncbi:hypothetical protein [Streptosporangium sp. NPDC049046]|uniref:hypothetical protein n=1 Tax=Streptosporangium sp. NPDC049046 TaxID=3155031 RepID=UPI003446DA7C
MNEKFDKEDAPPPYASLQAGLTGRDIFNAISKSGYPFQAEVADVLRTALSEFDKRPTIQEEWAYVDSDSGQTRSIDVLAEASILDSEFETQYKGPISPYVSLLIECKQSETPYIFFLRGDYPTRSFSFPEIAGLKNTDVQIYGFPPGIENDAPWLMSIHDLIGCHHLPFFNTPTLFAVSFAKSSWRKGGNLELSGEEAYRGLTLPLIKASEHFRGASSPAADQDAFTLRFIVPLAVIRAPMIGAYLHNGKHVLMGIPWVRCCRTDPWPDKTGSGPFLAEDSNLHYFDVVHESFLSEYLNILMRDMRSASENIIKNSEVIAAGYGVHVPNDSSDARIASLPEDILSAYNLSADPIGRISAVSPPLEFELSPDVEKLADGDLMWVFGDRIVTPFSEPE